MSADRLTVHVVEPEGDDAERLAGALAPHGVDLLPGRVGDLTMVIGGEEPVRDASEAGARRIVAVVDGVDRRTATALLEAGASGVIVAGTPPSAVATALRAVSSGFIVLPEVARLAVKRAVLTVRQQEILRLLVLGLSNAEIAAKLYVSESTVKTHISALFAKLEVRTRKDAIDAVLDPASPLRTAVLGFSDADTAQGDYRSPEIR